MKKFELKLDDLQVESFQTDGTRQPKGTVHAHTGQTGCDTLDVCCGANTVGGYRTCDTTCDMIICNCTGGGQTQCDLTCPNYWNAEQESCLSCPYGCTD